jgi:hypothetical protein
LQRLANISGRQQRQAVAPEPAVLSDDGEMASDDISAPDGSAPAEPGLLAAFLPGSLPPACTAATGAFQARTLHAFVSSSFLPFAAATRCRDWRILFGAGAFLARGVPVFGRRGIPSCQMPQRRMISDRALKE